MSFSNPWILSPGWLVTPPRRGKGNKLKAHQQEQTAAEQRASMPGAAGNRPANGHTPVKKCKQ